MSRALDLSVVVVNWNVRDLLRGCLKSVYAQMQTVSLEVLVVDNASSDGSCEMVEGEFPWVRLIRNEENVGFAKANNRAIRQSCGRYIMFLNPDTIVVDDALSRMVLFMNSHADAGTSGPRLLNPDGTIQMVCARHFPTPLTELWDLTKLSRIFPSSRLFGRSLMSYWPHTDTREVELISGACMMVRREAIDQVGLMDEQFFLFAEDTDWCYRFKKSGWKIYLNADAEVVHFGGESMKRSASDTSLESCKSLHLFFMRYYGRMSAFSYRTMLFFFVGLRIPVYWAWQYLRPADRTRVRTLLKQYPRILRWSLHPGTQTRTGSTSRGL